MRPSRTNRQPGRTVAASQLPADVDISERAGEVVIDTAAEHELEHRAVSIQPARRPYETAMSEAALTPDIGGGEKKKSRLVLAGMI